MSCENLQNGLVKILDSLPADAEDRVYIMSLFGTLRSECSASPSSHTAELILGGKNSEAGQLLAGLKNKAKVAIESYSKL